MTKVSVVIPAKNEAVGLRRLLPELKKSLPHDVEIIVVNDGSTDETETVCQENKVVQIKNPYSKGNGAAVKAGARAAKGRYIVFMDADGQHRPEDIPKILERLESGYDLVVGARSGNSQASFARKIANKVYNYFASYITGRKIEDLTSGLRAADAEKFREFLHIMPNGFSYPTTSTMAFYRAGYSVAFEPIVALKREGASHINLLSDGVRFLLIIFKVGTLYSPLKVFFPLAVTFFAIGVGWYGYTFVEFSRFTNMSALMMTAGLLIFVLGLISEQITILLYRD